jgi:hypothetical protein
LMFAFEVMLIFFAVALLVGFLERNQ